MNRFSSTVFAQLFYLRNGLFVTKGLPHAIENGVYKETFSVGSMRYSTLEFLHKTTQKQFWFQSTVVLGGTYREFYRFEASPYGVQEKYTLCYLKDGWVERELTMQELQPLVSILSKSQHVVYESSCK